MKQKNAFQEFRDSVLNSVQGINESKIFAGIVIILMNVSSKFVSIPLSKTMESYIKNSFSRHLLVFAMAWVGTRDILVSLLLTAIFFFLMEFLLNEKSSLCCLPEGFTSYYLEKVATGKDALSSEEIQQVMATLNKAKSIIDKENKNM
jgi:hypothetical protein